MNYKILLTLITFCDIFPLNGQKLIIIKPAFSEVDMRLKDIREDKDVTQSQLAEFLHIKQNTYSQYENGHRSIPVDVLISLADYFDTSVDYLLGLTNEQTPYPPAKQAFN